MDRYKIGDIVYYPEPVRAFLRFAGNSKDSDSALKMPLLTGSYTLHKLEVTKVNELNYDCKDLFTGLYYQGVSGISENKLFDNIDDYILYTMNNLR